MSRKPAVLQFIEEERAKGATDKQIQHDLLDAGWQMDIIKHAMGEKHPHAGHVPKAQPPQSQLRTILVNPYVIGGVFAGLVLIALFI